MRSMSTYTRQYAPQLRLRRAPLRGGIGRFPAGERGRHRALSGAACRPAVHRDLAPTPRSLVALAPGSRLCRSYQGPSGTTDHEGHSNRASAANPSGGAATDWPTVPCRDMAGHAIGTQGAIAQRRHTRDKALLLLLGFWRGFRSGELIRLETQNVELVPGQGMTCFLPRT